MATGDRRLGSSVRRGMTVLGKIPAVPKPINLPSQRLENRGLDPSVEIVPRGTFSWGTGRSPPTSGSSWGTGGLSSSPPVGSGAWNTASPSSPLPSSNNNSGCQNPSRPMSAGSTRPSSAGASRPLSASTTSGRAWGGAAAKLEEQVQPSRFNLTTAEFPTLGSEKNLNLRPQQSTAPSNRPTSADAMKERHLTYADHYQSGMPVDRPTSADGTKERKPVFSGVPHADRPTSADGTHPDKGRQQPARRLPSQPPFADGTLSDPRHPVYTGVVGHGTAGPGPGTLDRPKENFSSHPVPVQHAIVAQGREFVFPGASQHDLYFNRPGGPHGNDVVVLPMDSRPEVYGSYAFDSRPNHPDMSRVHHPQTSWGPNHLDRSGMPQGQFLQSGPSDHFHVMHQPHRRMEAAVLHEPVVGGRRDGFGISDKAFVEQRGGWAGTNVVYIGSAVDARESSIPMAGTGQEFPRPDMFISSWGHQPMHAGWGNMYGGDRTMGMYQEMPSSVIQQQTKLIETMPQRSTGEVVSENTENSEAGTRRIDEAVHAGKQEETIKTPSVKILAAGPDISKNRNNLRAIGSPIVETQPSKTEQDDEGTKAEQNREPKKINLISNMASKAKQEDEGTKAEQNREPKKISLVASQRQEDNCHGNFQGSHRDHFVAKDSNIGAGEDVKGTSKKKTLKLQQSIKGKEEMDLHVHDREERTLLTKAADGHHSNLLSADLSTTSGKEFDNDLKDTCADGFPKTAENTQSKISTKDLKASSMPNCALPGGGAFSEEEKAPLDDGSKTKRNGHSVRRAHGRSMHESHSVDRQHVNHGMVWAPKPTALGGTKEEVQPPPGDIVDMHESLQKIATDVKMRRVHPSLEPESKGESQHGSKGECQVQQMQSAASSQQLQGQQVQDRSVVSSKKPAQQVHHQRGERSSKQQGHRIQRQQARSYVSEQSVKDEQSVLVSGKNQNMHIKYQQSVTSSHIESETLPGQFIAISEREAQVKQTFPSEEAEKAGEVISLEKLEGKKNNNAYVRRPARNQHHQQREQDYEVVNNHHGQHCYSNEEKSVAEEPENPASETSAISTTELRKNHKDAKSRSSRNAKHRKGDLHESAVSLPSTEGHVLSGDRSQVDIRTEAFVPYLSIEVKEVKDKDERTHNQKVVRQQEMHIKQSATGEHRHFGEELKEDLVSCVSSTRAEKRLYVPKQARKQCLQQECEATGPQGQMIQDVYLSNEKGQDDDQGSQPSVTHAPVRKNDMERYTPLPARQPNMQGQQLVARGQRGQRNADLAQAIRASSGHVGSESTARITDSVGKGDESQPCARASRALLTPDSAQGQRGQRTTELAGAQVDRVSSSHAGSEFAQRTDSWGKGDESQPCALEHKGESKLQESSESAQSKKEVKHYIVKSGGQQQQSVLNVNEEAPKKEEKWQRSHRAPAAEPSKRKEGMKLYTPKPARQEETSVTSEGTVAMETGALTLPEHHDPAEDGKEERTQEFDHSRRNRNHSMKALKYAPSYRSSKRNFPPLDNFQSTLEDTVHVSRVDETNGSINKEHKKGQESGLPQKVGLGQGNIDAIENPSLDVSEVSKPRQYQRRHYHYQPVAQQSQTAKTQTEESIAHRPNNKQVDQAHSRYEKREGPRRGRGHGYGYRAGEHADSIDMR